MLIGFIWSQVVLVVGVIVVWRLERQRDRERREDAKELAEVVARVSKVKAPEPIVVPPPDLTPYLDRLSAMTVSMAREVASGVALIVQGPSQPLAEPEPRPTADLGDVEEAVPVEYPPWESDPSWGITDDFESNEWTAHTTASPVAHYAPSNGDGGMFGAGGIVLPDRE